MLLYMNGAARRSTTLHDRVSEAGRTKEPLVIWKCFCFFCPIPRRPLAAHNCKWRRLRQILVCFYSAINQVGSGCCSRLGSIGSMSVVFAAVKWSALSLNIMSLFLAVGAIGINASGLEDTYPGTDAHTYFILGIILNSLLCLAVIFGCYGVLSEIFAINVIYSFVILILLPLQCLQEVTFQPYGFYRNTLQYLEEAWRLVKVQPKAMDSLQTNYRCCGLFSGDDYSHEHLELPSSCFTRFDNQTISNVYGRGCLEALHKSYRFVVQRQRLFNLSLIVLESAVFVNAIVLSVILYKRSYNQRQNEEPVPPYPILNHHIDRQAHPMSN